MTQVSSVNAAATQASQAAQASQANAEAGNTTATQPDVSKLGLPPDGLAQAASANTVNAELVSSQWGIDPASVSGTYGGAGQSGGLFANDNLLPLLESLSPATAEKALALIGIRRPTPGSGSGQAAAYVAAGPVPTTTARAISPAGQAMLDQAASSSAPVVVDPLWGRTA
ncbi:MAG: hypothetical protein ABSD62_12525 [Candidatus Limnocylindrales bacterium]